MKNSILKGIALSLVIVFSNACSSDELDLSNPNVPGRPALQSEEGAKRAALGVYNKFSSLYYLWLTLTNHEVMGDSYVVSAGNFAWRWTNQVKQITLSDGTVLTPPQGATQPEELKARNSRSFGDDNAFYHEWELYFVNNQANLVLSVATDPAVQFTGNADTKRRALQAWAYWWKGFVYSRIGSIYIAGIINDVTDQTNSDFVPYQEIITEANANFDKAILALTGLTKDADYDAILNAAIPSFLRSNKGKGGVPSPAAWIRHMNTYKARNILVNKKLSEMTATDWNAILTLTSDGLQAADPIFTMRTAAENAVLGSANAAWMPWRVLNGWAYISERLVQDFKPGDDRFTRNIVARPGGALVNISGRGYQYGTRWTLVPVENGGDYASNLADQAEIPLGATYEENQLMRAEALIMTGNIDDGLALIDEVRTYQNAQLPAVANTGLDLQQAYEELRRERRIGLLNKNVSFYDARRWGVILPISQGGGRTGAVVNVNVSPTFPTGVDTNATIEYNYLSRFDVPLNELDFNKPSNPDVPLSGS